VQHALLMKTHKQARLHAAQESPPTSVCIVGGHKGGGAGGVDAVAGALQAKRVGHPPALVRSAVACRAVGGQGWG
jgi:hypothetical protein